MSLNLRVIGAGLPRTATSSLSLALERLLGGRVNNMSAIPGHPFNLGEGWRRALGGGTPNWNQVLEGYIAAVDWPASAFWQELGEAYPDALILLSVRDSAETWLQSLEATILPVTRPALSPDWKHGRDLVTLFEQFTGTSEWDDPATLMEAYERHNDTVRKTAPQDRLLEWQATEGWEPICKALGVPVPNEPFPWVNKRNEWG